PRTAVLSGAVRADVFAAYAKPDVDGRLCAFDSADRGLRCAPVARAGNGCGASGRRQRCADAGLDDESPLGLPRRGTVGPVDRGDRAYLDRRSGGATALGAAAVALSPHLGAGVPVEAAVAAQMDADAAAARDRGCRGAACGRWRAEPVVDARRASGLLLRDGLPCRAGRHPPARQISHRVLCRAVLGRHARRAVCRADLALCVLLGRRISDPLGTSGALPASRRRTLATMEPLVLAIAGGAR